MWLYRFLNGLFPSSFGAKLAFVSLVAAIVPPAFTAAYLVSIGGQTALMSPFLFLSIAGSFVATSLTIIGQQMLLQPLSDLRSVLAQMHSSRVYSPLPEDYGDDIGRAMTSTNQIAEVIGARLDPRSVDGFIDPLTGVFTNDGLENALLEAEAGSLLAISVDRYAAILDAHDQVAADRVLALVGRVLRETTRQGDILGRTGDAAFCVFLSGAGREVARHVAERIRVRIASETQDMEPVATVSAGLAVRAPQEDTDTAWERASEALTDAQLAGTDQVILARSA